MEVMAHNCCCRSFHTSTVSATAYRPDSCSKSRTCRAPPVQELHSSWHLGSLNTNHLVLRNSFPIGGVKSPERRRRLNCTALWGRDRNERRSTRIQRPPPQSPETNGVQDSGYPSTSGYTPRQGQRPPPNFPPSPDPLTDEDSLFEDMQTFSRAAGGGAEREMSDEELLAISRRIRARIRQLRNQRRARMYGEGFQGLSMFTSGLNPEMINGRCAMVGFVAAMVNELTTGRTVWEQLTMRGGMQIVLIPLTVVLIMLSSYAPGANEMEDDGLSRPSKPFGPFNSWAERINGRFAMIGFISLVAIEAFTGEALFKIGWFH